VHPVKLVLKKFLTAELMRFIVVGIVSAAIEFSLLFLFKLYIDYRLANILAFVVTNVITFTLTRRYVFTSNGNRAEEQKLFVICLGGALLVNHVVLWSLVEYVALDMRVAKLVAISVTVVWNYITRKNIVFRNRVNAIPEVTAVKDFPAKKF
jgi:putative flippase GtrA